MNLMPMFLYLQNNFKPKRDEFRDPPLLGKPLDSMWYVVAACVLMVAATWLRLAGWI
jgi:hypothetical protein